MRVLCFSLHLTHKESVFAAGIFSTDTPVCTRTCVQTEISAEKNPDTFFGIL